MSVPFSCSPNKNKQDRGPARPNNDRHLLLFSSVWRCARRPNANRKRKKKQKKKKNSIHFYFRLVYPFNLPIVPFNTLFLCKLIHPYSINWIEMELATVSGQVIYSMSCPLFSFCYVFGFFCFVCFFHLWYGRNIFLLLLALTRKELNGPAEVLALSLSFPYSLCLLACGFILVGHYGPWNEWLHDLPPRLPCAFSVCVLFCSHRL